MATSRSKKEEQLAKLQEGLKSAKGVVFAGYSGLTVAQMSDLRRVLRADEVEFMVAKKTLVRKAASELGLKEIPAELLAGQIGVAFSAADEVAPARLTHNFAKKNEAMELRGGIMNGALLSEAEVKNLATLPSKEELLAKVVGCMIAPVRGFVGTSAGVVSGFVRTLDAIREQKPAE